MSEKEPLTFLSVILFDWFFSLSWCCCCCYHHHHQHHHRETQVCRSIGIWLFLSHSTPWTGHLAIHFRVFQDELYVKILFGISLSCQFVFVVIITVIFTIVFKWSYHLVRGMPGMLFKLSYHSVLLVNTNKRWFKSICSLIQFA